MWSLGSEGSPAKKTYDFVPFSRQSMIRETSGKICWKLLGEKLAKLSDLVYSWIPLLWSPFWSSLILFLENGGV